MSNQPCAVPLIELLARIPADARYSYTETDGLKATHFIPVGRYAHEAVAELASLRRELAEVKADAARYRWLRQGHGSSIPDPQRFWGQSDDSIDECIDSAIASQDKP